MNHGRNHEKHDVYLFANQIENCGAREQRSVMTDYIHPLAIEEKTVAAGDMLVSTMYLYSVRPYRQGLSS